jgi:hypothetical protein
MSIVARVQNIVEKMQRKEGSGEWLTATADALAKRTGLKNHQIYDSMFILTKRGVIEKRQAGARYRPMVFRLIGGERQLHSGTTPLLVCRRCGHELDLKGILEDLRAQKAKMQELTDAGGAIVEALLEGGTK